MIRAPSARVSFAVSSAAALKNCLLKNSFKKCPMKQSPLKSAPQTTPSNRTRPEGPLKTPPPPARSAQFFGYKSWNHPAPRMLTLR
jgi:hypothetical protein